MLDPAGCVFHGLGRKAATVNAAVDFAAQQAGGLQHAQVLGYRRKGHIEGLSKFADGRFALRQTGEDGAAGVIGERAEDVIERGGGHPGIVNHMV